MSKSLTQLRDEIHQLAIDKGWYDSNRNIPELLCLVHEEVSETLKEYRDGHLPTEVYYDENGKPEGIGTELADIMIRVLDICGFYGIDIDRRVLEKHEFNKTRPYRHGNKVC